MEPALSLSLHKTGLDGSSSQAHQPPIDLKVLYHISTSKRLLCSSLVVSLSLRLHVRWKCTQVCSRILSADAAFRQATTSMVTGRCSRLQSPIPHSNFSSCTSTPVPSFASPIHCPVWFRNNQLPLLLLVWQLSCNNFPYCPIAVVTIWVSLTALPLRLSHVSPSFVLHEHAAESHHISLATISLRFT